VATSVEDVERRYQEEYLDLRIGGKHYDRFKRVK